VETTRERERVLDPQSRSITQMLTSTFQKFMKIQDDLELKSLDASNKGNKGSGGHKTREPTGLWSTAMRLFPVSLLSASSRRHNVSGIVAQGG
jgi:hypothetical protein